MSSSLNFNPFKGYPKEEPRPSEKKVRESVKEFAQLDGAIIIDHDGIAVAACVSLNAERSGLPTHKGFGTRHLAAMAISRKTSGVAVCVSQTSGTVRVYHGGEGVMNIEPLKRTHVWQPLRLEALESENEDEDNGGQ